MARLRMTAPPKNSAPYAFFRPWLEANFKIRSCGYCLTGDTGREIDHYEPWKSFRPNRKNDPSNLILSCQNCNSAGGKWDYHPDHLTRRCYSGIRCTHLVYDVRNEDVALHYRLDADTGNLTAVTPRDDRFTFVCELLKLNQPVKSELRKKVLQCINNMPAYEAAVNSANETDRPALRQLVELARDLIRKHELLVTVLELES